MELQAPSACAERATGPAGVQHRMSIAPTSIHVVIAGSAMFIGDIRNSYMTHSTQDQMKESLARQKRQGAKQDIRQLIQPELACNEGVMFDPNLQP